MKNFRLGLTIIVFSVFLRAVADAQMMGPPPVPMSPQQFAHARAGQDVQIAVRIQRVNRSTLYAELLQHQTDTLARATGKAVTLFLADGTAVVMGTADEIRPGAVLFVYGVLTKPANVDIKRVVIDTKYVKVR